MNNRFKQLTVQQLLDAGFHVHVSKHCCGNNSLLDSKQWVVGATVQEVDDTVWASVTSDTLKLSVSFFE